jgi:hypothetical protein
VSIYGHIKTGIHFYESSVVVGSTDGTAQQSWNDIAEYGRSKQDWFGAFLRLPGGIPSRDTFNRVFAALDPEEIEKGFVDWVSSIAK